MQRYFKYIAIVFMSLFSCQLAWADVSNDPTGFWQTVDDKTGKVLSVIEFTKAEDGTYNGKIVKIMPVNGQKPTDVCKACTGKKKDQPILGMTIISGMQADSKKANTWHKGHAFDPNTNNTYHAQMTLSADGQKLFLRGYIGIPLFGRTETWLRTTNPNQAAAQQSTPVIEKNKVRKKHIA